MAYYPYCVHGVYVGGCGIDWMCHDCEMGYEVSSEQLAKYKADREDWANRSDEEQFAALPAHVLDEAW